MTIFARLSSFLHSMPISRKIVAICAVSSIVTLTSLCSISVYREWQEFKENKISSIRTIMDIVASNSQAPLRFNDYVRAQEYLSSLQHETDISYVALFDRDDNIFAIYSEKEETPKLDAPKNEEIQWLPDTIHFSRFVNVGDQRYGSLLVIVDKKAFRESVLSSILISVALFMAGIIISIILAYRLQHLIAQPIKDLELTAKEVRNTNNYSARVLKRYDDEVGSLVDSFNSMLEKIEHSDASLREINASLERVVEQRTKDLKIQNHALKEAMDAANAASISKSEFLATTSHELRTPLNPIIGYVEKIQRDSGSAPYARDLTLIKQSAEQLLRLIEDILDYSRIESGTLKLKEDEVDIEKLGDDVVRLLSQQARQKSISLSHTYSFSDGNDSAPQNVSIDQGRLRQILLNLANNAIKFTQEGSVTIDTRIERSDNNSAILRLDVTDTGIGIDPRDRDKLFKPFSQLDASWTREYGGMGLGLAICKRIVKAMGGNLECESERGRGSRFFATIPVRLCERKFENQLTGDKSEFSLDVGVRVLLVEDEPVNRELMDTLLSSLGHDVTTAKNGVEAVEKASAAEFDFILLDISMPKMDGFEAAARIRQFSNGNESLPIVAMTAHATPEDKDSCLLAGMNDYLTKPVSFSKLKSVLGKWAVRKPTN